MNSQPRYDACLSSMWGMKNFPYFPDFFPAAERLGFAGVELNHQVTPGMLEGVDLERYRVGSLHEPCPAVISAAELKKRDLLISSPAEDHRREGVDSIKRTIDLAAELGCQTVVVHCGQIQGDISLEFRLKDMCDSGQCGTPEFIEVKERFIARRASLAGPYLESVRKSLVELLEYVGHSNIRLGLENRFHFFDIPNGEEMSYLLDVAGPERLPTGPQAPRAFRRRRCRSRRPSGSSPACDSISRAPTATPSASRRSS